MRTANRTAWDNLKNLVAGMNELATQRNGPVLELDAIKKQILDRDVQVNNTYSKDAQIMLIENTRKYGPDKRRVAKPHKLLDPSSGPLIAVRMNILTRKSLGGLETDLNGIVMDQKGQPCSGLYAAGEVAGFGGGGVHGYSSLEGTFLGGCISSGYQAGRALAERHTQPAAKE